jgi:hypothetical protein
MAFPASDLDIYTLWPLRVTPYPPGLAFLLGVCAVIIFAAVMYEGGMCLILRVVKMHMSHDARVMFAATLDNESSRAQELVADTL